MIVKRNHIFLNQKCENKAEILESIAKKSFELGISDNEEETLAALLHREEDMTTDLGIGIAIPHAKTDSVNKVAVIFYRNYFDVDWDDGSLLRSCVVFLTPESNIDNIHLKMLASVSRKLIDDDFRNMLMESDDKEKIYLAMEDALSGVKVDV